MISQGRDARQIVGSTICTYSTYLIQKHIARWLGLFGRVVVCDTACTGCGGHNVWCGNYGWENRSGPVSGSTYNTPLPVHCKNGFSNFNSYTFSETHELPQCSRPFLRNHHVHVVPCLCFLYGRSIGTTGHVQKLCQVALLGTHKLNAPGALSLMF
jgi:hypothetical protein